MTVDTDAILRVVASFDLAGVSVAQNVYHMKHLTGTAQDDEDVVDAAEEFISTLMTNFATQIHQSVELEQVEVFELVSSLWEPIGEATSAWVGTGSASDRTSSGLALMVNLFKSRTGYNDRKFIAGFMEGGVSGDAWSSTILSAADDFVTDIVPNFTASNSVVLAAVHFDRTTELVKRYTGGEGDSRVAYQRRRKPGVGLT